VAARAAARPEELPHSGTHGKEVPMKISARNVLKGKVVKVLPGAVNTEVTVELPNGTLIVSVITKSSARALGLKKGKPVYAVIKASSVMIATD
jgi:molybdopterin-binding protein